MVLLVKADARHIPLPDNSVQCCVTSPPYWGLRKYSGEQELVWGGGSNCQHEWGEKLISKANDSNRGTMEWATGGDPGAKVLGERVCQGQFCSCGAWRGAYGLEPTVEMYVEHTVQILREIRRVLRKDGVCFWNIGDSYAGGHVSYSNKRWQHGAGPNVEEHRWLGQFDNLKPKDLCLIPFRVALAAQASGWWVRADIVWSKPNPMPESVTDRPTRSHEYILMLTKSADYYWDADAVREPYNPDSIDRYKYSLDGTAPTSRQPGGGGYRATETGSGHPAA